ncbi:polysaccharide deacetylase family protein [Hellea balneolensis]|uniref:polysaccharide deacetylase family protein n=1 Tax=Hellea balneolensis TaxID=287478 RepID=UPI0004051F82|nr:polysaccharide deacetylase family protein [Hellea balneolensis]
MLSRRHFITGALALGGCAPSVVTKPAKRLAVTMDDFNIGFNVRLNPRERNERILAALDAHNHKAAGFVTGRFIDSMFGDEVVKSWSDAGHLIGNHTYSHLNSSDEDADVVKADILKNHDLLSQYSGYEKIFRFPFLAEGGSAEKIELYRKFLRANGFQNGAVTIDTVDWYITSRLESRLKADKNADLDPYRDYYVQAVVTLAEHFQGLTKQIGKADIPHSMLIHHNILNGLFLDDALRALKDAGWSLIDAKEAFSHPIYKLEPKIPTRSRSLLSVLAQEQGITDTGYPEAYRNWGKKTMDALRL